MKTTKITLGCFLALLIVFTPALVIAESSDEQGYLLEASKGLEIFDTGDCWAKDDTFAQRLCCLGMSLTSEEHFVTTTAFCPDGHFHFSTIVIRIITFCTNCGNIHCWGN